MKIAFIVSLAFFILSCNRSEGEEDAVVNFCSYVVTEQNPTLCKILEKSSFASDKEAEDVIRNITETVGLPKANFTLVSCPKTDNCFATIIDGKRYIVYDNLFLNKLKDTTSSDWNAISIMAHEIGHHLNGHTLSDTHGAEKRDDELEADNFSGYILAKLGANLIQAQSALNSLPHPECDNEISTHPCKLKRLKAVEEGWLKANKPIASTPAENEVLPFTGLAPAVSDQGIDKLPKFMADVNNDGVLDFGRFVGNHPKLFLSFQFGEQQSGLFNKDSYNYNSYEKVDKGILTRKIWLQDVNKDGRLDYCRYVGNFPNIYRAALLGTVTGFDGEHYFRF